MYVQEFLPELLESVSPLVSLQNPLRRCAARISWGLGWVTATAVTHPKPHDTAGEGPPALRMRQRDLNRYVCYFVNVTLLRFRGALERAKNPIMDSVISG